MVLKHFATQKLHTSKKSLWISSHFLSDIFGTFFPKYVFEKILKNSAYKDIVKTFKLNFLK